MLICCPKSGGMTASRSVPRFFFCFFFAHPCLPSPRSEHGCHGGRPRAVLDHPTPPALPRLRPSLTHHALTRPQPRYARVNHLLVKDTAEMVGLIQAQGFTLVDAKARRSLSTSHPTPPPCPDRTTSIISACKFTPAPCTRARLQRVPRVANRRLLQR